MSSPSLIPANWPAPASVCAAFTTRAGGLSTPPYDGFNVADHVGDEPALVAANRQILQTSLLEQFGASALTLHWLQQVHGTEVSINTSASPALLRADAAFTQEAARVCVVLTADCLPVLLCDEAGRQVAAIHAGWRGLAAGIITRTVTQFSLPGSRLLAYLGPAISQAAFQVGAEVLSAFEQAEKQRAYSEPVRRAFQPDPEHGNKYRCNLYALARCELKALGIERIYGGDFCTFTDDQRFFSFRRNGVCGRMASLIFLRY